MSVTSSPLDAPRTDWVLTGLLFAAGLLAAGQFAKISLTLGPLERVYAPDAGALPWAVSAGGYTPEASV